MPRRGRGEGSVEKMPDGRYRGVLSLGVDPLTGKRRRRKVYGRTKGEALQKLRAEQAKAGTLPAADRRLTVADWVDRWLAAKKASVAPNTLVWYTRYAKHVKRAIGPLFLARLSPADVQGMFAKLTDSQVPAGEQRNAATTLRVCLQAAEDLGLIVANPARKVKKPKARARDVRALTAAQSVAVLRGVARDRLRAVYALMLDAGCRPGEAFGLHWPDLDLAAGSVYVRQSLEDIQGKFRLKEPKTERSRRRVRLTPQTVAELTAHRERMRTEGRNVDAGPVFVNSQGGFVGISNFNANSWRPLRKRLKLAGFRFYDLRHTSATLLLGAGVSLRVVADRLGHENPATTLRFYAAFMPDQQEEAVKRLANLLSPERPPELT